MKLIKVLFLFVFIISVNSYFSQTAYVFNQTATDGILTGDLYIAPTSCKDSSDGRLKIQDVTGQAPFTYRWEDPDGNNVRTVLNTFNNSDSLTEADIPAGLSVGVYILTVEDGGGVRILDFFPTLTDPNPLTFRPMGSGGTNFSNPSCNFGPLSADGTITSRAIGGTGTLSYEWDDPSSTANRTVSNLAPGLYSVVVTDQNGCKDTAEYQLFQPSLVVANASIAVPGCQGQNNTQLISTPTGGSGLYTFTWFTAGIPPIQIDQLAVPATSHQTIDVDNTSSDPMDYILQVVDDKGCTSNPADFAIQHNVPTTPTVVVGTNPFPTFCEGVPSPIMGGSVGGSATGGIWSGGIVGNWTNANDPLNATYTPSAGEASPITVTLTSTGGGCPSVSAQKTLSWNTAPTATVNSEAICDGDPAATFTATSATAVSWLWSANGTGTAQTTTGTTAGNYTVVVTDAQGCESAPATGILTVNALPAAAVNSEAICDGDPAATFTATSATAVSWLWSANGTGTAQTTTGTTAGNYTVVVTDAQGCESAPATGILTVNALPAAAVNSEAICDGDPAATFTATSATAVSWLWSANGTGTAQTTTGTTAGNYTVVVTDAQGCESAPATGILTVNALPAAAVNSEAICDGDPAATFTATSATAVSWLWSANGTGTAQTTTGTTAGNYTVVVTDAQGCESAPATGILTVNALPAAAVNSETICDGDPAATFTATSATAVSWLWSANGTGTAQTTTGTTAGNYTVVVTDAQGCESAPATGILTVNALPAAAVNSEAICDGDPAATFTATSATAVSWLWSANGTGTAQTTTGTTAGNYTVVVTDAQGCESAPATGILTVNALPAAAVNSEAICDGDPAATFTATSATAVSWLWSANGTGTAQTTTGTTAGNYTVVVTDAQGCESAPATGILTVNALPAAAVNSEAICDGDPAATFTATSATAVSWLWSANGTGTAQTTTGTTAGNYTVVVTDAQGCESAPATGILTVNALPAAAVNSEAICDGDPAATFTATSATAVSWLWSANGTGTAQTTTGTTAGNYTVVVTDAQGCESAPATGILTVNALPAAAVNSEAICDGDPAATFTATSATAVSWLWSANGTGTAQTTTGTTAGNYTVVVTDAQGCESAPATGILTVNALPAAAVNSETICDGDPAATFTATSATAVSWLWSANGTGTAQTTTGTTAGNYTVVVTDAQGCESAPATGILTVNALPAAAVNSEAICDGDPAATFTATSATAVSWLWSANGTGTAQTTTGTTAGNYTVVVTDAQGCESAPATGILTVNALPAAAVNSEAICDGDPAATFTATSATAVSWLWSANGTGTAQTTTGTTAGNYTVVVTDAQGCESAPATGILTVNALPAAAVNSETICDGDPAATFTATSATAVSWLWSANGTGTAQTTTGTTAGNYTVVVTDAQGCESAPATGILTVNALPAAAVNSEAICDGDPAATFTATSATAVSWLWSANGTGTAQTTTGTTAGNYTVVVTDAQGCESAPATGILTVNALPAAAVNSETICDGDPAATFTATSATAVSWLWSANGTGTAQTTTGTTAGNYTVVVTDAQGCESAPATGILTVNALPAAAVNSETICDGDPAATFTATSATAVSWLWSANGTGTAQTTTGTTAGNYTVVVTDAQGCESAPATGF